MNDFLNSNDNVFSMLVQVEQNAKFVIGKVWESVRFIATLNTAIFTAVIALIGAFGSKVMSGNTTPYILLFIAILPMMVILFSYIGINNLKREYRRFLEWVVIIDKLQEKLGFYSIDKSAKYPNDNYLIPERFVSNAYSCSSDFVESELKKRGNLYYHFKLLHKVFISLAAALSIGLVICLIYKCKTVS
jgi:hypothetical protein